MWRGDPGRCLIAVKGSLPFFCLRVTFRSVNTLQPYKMLAPADARVSGTLRSSLCGLFIYLSGPTPWHSLSAVGRWNLQENRLQKQSTVMRGAQTQASTPPLSVSPPPPPSIQLREDGWMKSQRLAAILSWKRGMSGAR